MKVLVAIDSSPGSAHELEEVAARPWPEGRGGAYCSHAHAFTQDQVVTFGNAFQNQTTRMP